MMKLYLFLIGMTVAGFASSVVAASNLPVGANTFALAPEISSSSGISAPVNLTGFTQQAGEPSHNPDDPSGQHSAWWSWTAQETGFCTVDTRLTYGTVNAMQETSLAVYTGDAVNNLTQLAACQEYGESGLQPDYKLSSVVFYAEAGKTYFIAADAAEPGDVTAMAFNVILQVRLVALGKAVRDGVWFVAGEQTLHDAGTVTVAMTATGRFSGKLGTSGKSYPFKGVFSGDGRATFSFDRPGKGGVPPKPPITLMLDVAGNGTLQVMMDNLQGSSLLPARTVFAKGSSSNATGRMTGVLQPNNDLSLGAGSLSMTVSSKGVVKGVGTAPDGTAYTFGSFQHSIEPPNYSYVPAHVNFSGKKGMLQMPLIIVEDGVKDGLGSQEGFIMRKAPTGNDVFYPLGAAASLEVLGKTYVPGAQGRALGFLNGSNGGGFLKLTNFNGELPGGNLQEALTLSESNKFTFNDLTRKPALTLNVKTGLVTGTIQVPPNKKRVIRGVLLEYGLNSFLFGLMKGDTVTLIMKVENP